MVIDQTKIFRNQDNKTYELSNNKYFSDSNLYIKLIDFIVKEKNIEKETKIKNI